MSTAYYSHPECRLHDMGAGHPECPQRLDAITDHLLRTGEMLPEPSFNERVRVLRRHFDLMIEVFGEELGCRMFRKIAP